MSDVESLADHYRSDPSYAQFEQVHRRGGTFGLTIVDVRQEAGEFQDPAVPEYAFVAGSNFLRPTRLDFGDGWVEHGRGWDWLDVQPAGTACRFELPPLDLRICFIGAHKLEVLLDQIGMTPAVFGPVTNAMRDMLRARAWVDQIWDAIERVGPAASLATDAAFLNMLAEVLHACGDERPLIEPPSVGDRRIGRVLDYIEAHIDQPLTVGELAELACVSLFHFGRVFRREIGTTPHRYVMGRRLEHAKDMLFHTELDLTFVALSTGFASHSHLTQTFKAATGMPPGEWRREARR